MQDNEYGDGNVTQIKVAAKSDKNRVSRCFVMRAPFGFHARPASLFAATAQRYDVKVMVGNQDGLVVNGKSLMGLLTLEIHCGEEIMITVEGPDAVAMVSALEQLFDGVFCPRKANVFSNANPIPDYALADAPHVA